MRGILEEHRMTYKSLPAQEGYPALWMENIMQLNGTLKSNQIKFKYILQLCNNNYWHISRVVPGWNSPTAMCYLTNEWIAYILTIDLIDAQA